MSSVIPTAVKPDDLCYERVFHPILSRTPLAHWTGFEWQHTQREAHGASLWVGPYDKESKTTLYLADFHAPGSRGSNESTIPAWWAIHAIVTWTSEVALKRTGSARIPPEWLILSACPGRREILPQVWINVGQQWGATWAEWKLSVELMSAGLVPMEKKGMELGLRLIQHEGAERCEQMLVNAGGAGGAGGASTSKGKPSAPPVPPAPPAPGPDLKRRPGRPSPAEPPRATLPTAWIAPFQRLVDSSDLKEGTLRVYRSHLRRIYSAAGNTTDLLSCDLAVSAINSTAVDAFWGRFRRFVDANTSIIMGHAGFRGVSQVLSAPARAERVLSNLEIAHDAPKLRELLDRARRDTRRDLS